MDWNLSELTLGHIWDADLIRHEGVIKNICSQWANRIADEQTKCLDAGHIKCNTRIESPIYVNVLPLPLFLNQQGKVYVYFPLLFLILLSAFTFSNVSCK